MTRKHCAALLIGLAVAVLTAVGVDTSNAATAAPGRLGVVHIGDDSFRNYDFKSKRVARNNVDWAVDFVFYNNAEIDRVKNAMDGFLPHTGSTMYGRLNDGAASVWDEDKGLKDKKCPIKGDAHHIRYYAPPERDRMYNRKWGYYIIGTAHIDHNECGLGRWYGRSEQAEATIELMARDVFGPSKVKRNHRYFFNYEPFRREGNHIWLNDGWATFVKVGG
jgi:hypothetical protein